jgi:hypothetical protein
MILMLKLTAGSTEFMQMYHNIRIEEPDASLFELPVGFRTLTLHPDVSGACRVQEAGVSGKPEPDEVTRFCGRP